MKIFLFAILFLIPIQGLPCTSLLLKGTGHAIVGKTQDWPANQGAAYINKRHVFKRAIFVPSPQMPLEWTSKYMSVTFTQSGREFPWEGMNERGLSVTIMFLASSVLPPTNDLRPGINGLQWIQYILDTSATVDEAMARAQATRITGDVAVQEHYFVCDINSQCATFENVNGNLVIHKGAALPYFALTNNTYDDSLRYLQKLLTVKKPEEILASQSMWSLERFSRAALFSIIGPSPNLDPISMAFNALENLHEAPTTKWPTQWRLVFNLENQMVYFQTLISPLMKGVSLKEFNPSCRVPVQVLDMNLQRRGIVNDAFSNYSSSLNQALINLQTTFSPNAKRLSGLYPETTRCLE